MRVIVRDQRRYVRTDGQLKHTGTVLLDADLSLVDSAARRRRAKTGDRCVQANGPVRLTTSDSAEMRALPMRTFMRSHA